MRKTPNDVNTRGKGKEGGTKGDGAPTTWRKNSWHRYDMKKLRHCHPMYGDMTIGDMWPRAAPL